MSVVAYAWGVLVLGGSVWLLGATAAVVSRRLDLATSPAVHVLSCIALVLCWLYAVSYALGAVGAFKALPFFLVLDGGAALVLFTSRRGQYPQLSTSGLSEPAPAETVLGPTAATHAVPGAGTDEPETTQHDQSGSVTGTVVPATAADNHPIPTGRPAPSRGDDAAGGGAAWSVVIRGAAVVGVVLVVIAYLPATAHAYRHGILEPDSTWYHGHFVGRFVQTGWLTRITPVGTDSLVPFHPLNRELLDAVLVLPWRRDLLLPLVSLAGLGLLLLAGWCVGSRWQRGPLGLLAAALIASPATFRLSQPGSLKNDLTATAFLVAGAALLVHCERRLPRVALAGAVLGLAAGTRANLLLPIGVLALFATWTFASGRAYSSSTTNTRVQRRYPAGGSSGQPGRWLVVATWLGSIAGFGSYWYLRNWIRVGNPLPWTELSVGPLGFDAVGDADQYLEQTMLHYRDEPELFSAAIRPGLDMAFGTNLWWAWAALAVASMGLAAARRSWLLVGMVTAGWLGVLVHPALPLSLSVEPTSPLAAAIVASTTRYLLPAVALILVAGAAATRSRRQQVGWALATLVLLAVGLRPNALLDSTTYDGQSADIPLAIGLGAALAAAASLTLVRSRVGARLWPPVPSPHPLRAASVLPPSDLPRADSPSALRGPAGALPSTEMPTFTTRALVDSPSAAESTRPPSSLDPVPDDTTAPPSPTTSGASAPTGPEGSVSTAGWARATGRGGLATVSAVAVPVLILATLAFPLFDHYLDERYAGATSVHGGDLWAVTRDLDGARIGMATTAVPYPYFGADFSNEVEYIGVARSGGLLRNVETCGEWVDEVLRRDLTHVALTPDPVIPLPTTTLQEWTLAIPGAQVIHGADGRVLIQLPQHAPFDGPTCPTNGASS